MLGSIHVGDIEWDQDKEAMATGEVEEYVVYLNQIEKLVLAMPSSDAI